MRIFDMEEGRGRMTGRWEGLHAPTGGQRRGVKPLPQNSATRGHNGGADGGFGEGQRLVAFGLAGVVLRHRELGAEFLERDQLEAAVMVLDDGGERFDPVAGVQVMNVPDHLVGGGVDVAADDTPAAAVAGERGDLFLEVADEADGLLDARLDRLAEREVLLAA